MSTKLIVTKANREFSVSDRSIKVIVPHAYGECLLVRVDEMKKRATHRERERE